MRPLNQILLLATLASAGCAPQVRFTSAVCQPEFAEDETSSLRFRSSFDTWFLDQQQLLVEATVLNGREQPVRSETGRFRDEQGHLTALRTVMVMANSQSFEDVELAIPTLELDAAQAQKP